MAAVEGKVTMQGEKYDGWGRLPFRMKLQVKRAVGLNASSIVPERMFRAGCKVSNCLENYAFALPFECVLMYFSFDSAEGELGRCHPVAQILYDFINQSIG